MSEHGEDISSSVPSALVVFVPARNEAHAIENCLRSVLVAATKLTIPSKIVVIDDQSSDGTGARVESIADNRIHLITRARHNDRESGKCAALVEGYEWARAGLSLDTAILFLDADVRLEPNSLARAIELFSTYDVISMSPSQLVSGIAAASAQPLIFGLLNRIFPFARVNDPNDPIAAANGQFILMRNSSYQAVGTHAAFSGAVLEDVALAVAVKRQGLRLHFDSGEKFGVSCQMYRSASAVLNGWSKNLYLLAAHSWPQTIAYVLGVGMAAALVSAIILYVTFSWGPLAGGLIFGLFSLLLSKAAGSVYTPAHFAFGFVMLGTILIRSTVWHRILGRVKWKERWIVL